MDKSDDLTTLLTMDFCGALKISNDVDELIFYTQLQTTTLLNLIQDINKIALNDSVSGHKRVIKSPIKCITSRDTEKYELPF